jgi:molybdate transport system substrate-binding protein
MKKCVTLFCFLMLMLAVSPVKAQELLVSAAASLTDAFNELKTEFAKNNPGVSIVTNYASSGVLYRQIEQGAPVDVYASANMRWMDELIARGIVEQEESHVFVHNNVVLAVPAGNPADVSSIQDLTREQVRRIGIGAPEHVPAGSYARKSLEDLGLWDSLQPKMIPGETVRQVLEYLRRAEVDAGFIFGSDAKRGSEAVLVQDTMPLKEDPKYPIAPLKASKEPELAQKFVAFVLSGKGQDILKKHGFSIP